MHWLATGLFRGSNPMAECRIVSGAVNPRRDASHITSHYGHDYKSLLYKRKMNATHSVHRLTNTSRSCTTNVSLAAALRLHRGSPPSATGSDWVGLGCARGPASLLRHGLKSPGVGVAGVREGGRRRRRRGVGTGAAGAEAGGRG